MKRLCIIMRNIIFAAALCIILSAVVCLMLQIKPAIVVSGSMEPEIHTGSLVFIDMKKTEAEVGDIIAFEKGSIFVTHRIEKITEEGYITKGDANKTADMGVVTDDAVIGTALFSIPYVGYFIRTLSIRL